MPVDHVEVDLVALHGGKPILVECKESTDHLGGQKGAEKFARQLAEQLELAEHIGAHKVIIASPSSFPEDKERLTCRVPKGSTAEIEWWDKEVLLDPLYLLGDAKPDNAEELHLEFLANSLTDPSER